MGWKEGRVVCRPRRIYGAQPTSLDRLFAAHYDQPTCHANHLPGYLKNYNKFKAMGVSVVAVIAANDPFVMSGWARVEGLKDKVNTPR